MIKLYRKSVYGDLMEDIMFTDPSGSEFVWDVGVYQAEKDFGFFDYRVVEVWDEWEILGWIFCWSYDAVQCSALIQEIYVCKDSRKKWIASNFIELAEKYYTGIWARTIKLKVFSHNKWAIKLYKKLWFEKMWYQKDSCSIWDIEYYTKKLENYQK